MLVRLPKATFLTGSLEAVVGLEVVEAVEATEEERPRLTILRLFANLEDDLVEGITVSVDDGTFSLTSVEVRVEVTSPRPR